MPASAKSADSVYIDGVKTADIYMVLIGKEYGNEDENGFSPTELEFDTALKHQKDPIAFVKDHSREEFHPKEKQFLNKVQKHVTYKRFKQTYDLIQEINHAFVSYLQEKGYLLTTSFDATLHPFAALNDIDKTKIDEFISIAQKYRNFPLRQGTSIKKALKHLDLLSDSGSIINSALLAFTTNPQKFFPTAIVKCAHFHGQRVEKPIPDHRIIKGDVFEQVIGAVDFVLAKISVSVGTRAESNQAPVTYEIPRAAVSEAIVNAIAHRDYKSKGSVEVWLFKDRLEVKNPGQLPKELNVKKLEQDHGSYPYNPRLAEILYQAAYIERFGTGTGEIFKLTADAILKKINKINIILTHHFIVE